MSVLSSKRTQSRAEYVNKANKIYIETIRFLTRLSARYARILAQPIADLAGDVLDNCERANTYYPKDDERKALRREALLKARGSLRALDVRLTHCYEIMTWNAQGCFSTSDKAAFDADTALIRLDRMAESLGNLIEEEDNLLRAVMESDSKR